MHRFISHFNLLRSGDDLGKGFECYAFLLLKTTCVPAIPTLRNTHNGIYFQMHFWVIFLLGVSSALRLSSEP